MRWLSLFLCLLSWPLLARGGERDAAMEHQLGLYLQHTRGALPAAIGAYERAVQHSADADLRESIYLRMAECLRLRGDRSQAALAALEKASSAEWKRFETAAAMPAQSNLILQVDLSRLELKRWAGGLKLDPPPEALALLRAFAKKTGIDPARAVHRVTLALTLESDPARLFDHLLLVAEGDLGRFAPGSFLAWLRDEAAAPPAAGDRSDAPLWRTRDPKTFRLHLPTDDPGRAAACCPGQREFLLSFDEEEISGLPGLSVRIEESSAGDPILHLALVKFDDARVLIGERRAVTQTIEALRGRLPGLRANAAMARQLSALPGDDVLWLVARPARMFSQVEVVQRVLGLEDELPQVLGLRARLRAGDELRLDVTATSTDRESASVLGDLALGSLAVVRLATAGDREKRYWLTAFLNGLSLNVDGTTVHLLARLPNPAGHGGAPHVP